MIGFRLDRLATLYVFGPFSKRATPRIPVLMYHSITDDSQDRRHPYYHTTTTVRAFDEQIRFLHDNQYNVIGLGDAVKLLDSKKRWDAGKYVVITFDDGYEDFYTNAFPILSKYRATATMFLPTQFIGDTPQTFKGIECLTWSRVREMMDQGITFGSHTVTHRCLDGLGANELDYELKLSKETIEQKTGKAVESFAYPFAFPEADRQFTRQLKDTLLQNGYEQGVSTIIGTATPSTDRLLLKRLPVNTWDDARLFRAKLDGAYDWLHSVQYATKLLGKGMKNGG
jgi:peptidoglycan/xylan/chitin deacetylase (PgdA/CDA1 family)